jgi:hypothetical protein
MGRSNDRLLAIAPLRSGFGYAAIEGTACLLDWGVSYRTKEHPHGAFPLLLRDYAPRRLLVPAAVSSAARRERLAELLAWASNVGCRASPVTALSVERVFGTTRSSHERAARLADHFPELSPRLPPRRQSWMSADNRLALFEAVALLAAHLSIPIT